MIKVYVAGAYSANNVLDVLKNIGRGQHYSAELFRLGFAPFCPWHDKEYVIHNWAEDLTVNMFYEYSTAWLEVSDCVFLVPEWENSKGTEMEIEKAKGLGIPVFEDINDLQEFFHAT